MRDVEARFLQNNFTDSRPLLLCSDSLFVVQSPCHEATGEGAVLRDSESDWLITIFFKIKRWLAPRNMKWALY